MAVNIEYVWCFASYGDRRGRALLDINDLACVVYYVMLWIIRTMSSIDIHTTSSSSAAFTAAEYHGHVPILVGII